MGVPNPKGSGSFIYIYSRTQTVRIRYIHSAYLLICFQRGQKNHLEARCYPSSVNTSRTRTRAQTRTQAYDAEPELELEPEPFGPNYELQFGFDACLGLSYLVLTGRYIKQEFNLNSIILRFSSFQKRHFSELIGAEIEKQLIGLNIFEKVTSN